MATISDDFLNSLSADDRDDFLKNIFEVFSMNPSKQDEMVAQRVRAMYKDHHGKLIKCTFCRKDEPDGQEFGQCARCGIVQYCSRECQKLDWKQQHKIECGKHQEGSKKLGWRLEQFYNFYTPMIDMLVLDMYRFMNKEMNNDDILFPEDDIVEIQLADLPQSAKRPRLYIEQVIVGKLSENEKERAYSRASLPEPGRKRVRYCLSYKTGSGENDTHFSYYQFQYGAHPNERSKFNQNTKKLYSENVDEHVGMINSLARGNNPKIYKVIKEILKENNG